MVYKTLKQQHSIPFLAYCATLLTIHLIILSIFSIINCLQTQFLDVSNSRPLFDGIFLTNDPSLNFCSSHNQWRNDNWRCSDPLSKRIKSFTIVIHMIQLLIDMIKMIDYMKDTHCEIREESEAMCRLALSLRISMVRMSDSFLFFGRENCC